MRQACEARTGQSPLEHTGVCTRLCQGEGSAIDCDVDGFSCRGTRLIQIGHTQKTVGALGITGTGIGSAQRCDELCDRGRTRVFGRHGESACGHIRDGAFQTFSGRRSQRVFASDVDRFPCVFENLVSGTVGRSAHHTGRNWSRGAQIADGAWPVDDQFQTADVIGAERVLYLDTDVDSATGIDGACRNLTATAVSRSFVK